MKNKGKMDEKGVGGRERIPQARRQSPLDSTQIKQFPNGVLVLGKIPITGMQAATHPQNIENQWRIILHI